MVGGKQYFYKGKPVEELSREELLKALKSVTDRILTELPTIKYDHVNPSTIPTPFHVGLEKLRES